MLVISGLTSADFFEGYFYQLVFFRRLAKSQPFVRQIQILLLILQNNGAKLLFRRKLII